MCNSCMIVTNDGKSVNIGSVAATISRNGDGTIAYVEFIDPSTSNTYRQTYSYTGGLLTSQTAFIKQ